MLDVLLKEEIHNVCVVVTRYFGGTLLGTGGLVRAYQKATQTGLEYQLDLWGANEIVLTEAGVLKEKIAVTNICTCCNPDLLFSHRASHGKRGNLGAFLKLV
mgnify:CR=1 FL=1